MWEPGRDPGTAEAAPAPHQGDPLRPHHDSQSARSRVSGRAGGTKRRFVPEGRYRWRKECAGRALSSCPIGCDREPQHERLRSFRWTGTDPWTPAKLGRSGPFTLPSERYHFPRNRLPESIPFLLTIFPRETFPGKSAGLPSSSGAQLAHAGTDGLDVRRSREGRAGWRFGGLLVSISAALLQLFSVWRSLHFWRGRNV